MQAYIKLPNSSFAIFNDLGISYLKDLIIGSGQISMILARPILSIHFVQQIIISCIIDFLSKHKKGDTTGRLFKLCINFTSGGEKHIF